MERVQELQIYAERIPISLEIPINDEEEVILMDLLESNEEAPIDTIYKNNYKKNYGQS